MQKQQMQSTIDPWQPSIDPWTGQMVPCVMCAMSPQIEAYNGCCSSQCEDELIEWVLHGGYV